MSEIKDKNTHTHLVVENNHPPVKRKPGRPPGKKDGPMSTHHREKISKSRILGRLIKHAEGELSEAGVLGNAPMTATQVTAAVALLKKIVPDLSSQELVADVKTEKIVNKVVIQAVAPNKDE